jgi:hypothetical protein
MVELFDYFECNEECISLPVSTIVLKDVVREKFRGMKFYDHKGILIEHMP